MDYVQFFYVAYISYGVRIEGYAERVVDCGDLDRSGPENIIRQFFIVIPALLVRTNDSAV